jgi:hypothetical protein
MDLSDFVQVRQKRVHRGGVRQWLAPKIVPWLKAPLKVGPQARLALGVVLGDLVGGHAGNGQQQRRNHSRPVLTGGQWMTTPPGGALATACRIATIESA